MKGKASEIPVKNFRIADDEKAGDVKELPARPAVHGKFSNNEVVDATAGATATVAARTPDTPLSEVYADPNAAQETAAIAATDASVEAPQVNSAANGAAADGPIIDHDHEQPLEEQELEGDAADIARTNDRFVPAVNKVATDSGLKIVTFLKRDRFFGDAWRKLDEKQQESKIDEIYDLAKQICYGNVDAVASRGFDFVEMTLTSVKITMKEDGGRKCDVAGTVRYDEAFVIDSVENKTLMVVPRNTNQFLGGMKVKPDVIGTLRLPDPELPLGAPTSGPGTPTPIVVMDAVGKGPEAAAAAAAVVTGDEAATVAATAVAVAAEPAPAPATVA